MKAAFITHLAIYPHRIITSLRLLTGFLLPPDSIAPAHTGQMPPALPVFAGAKPLAALRCSDYVCNKCGPNHV